MEPPPEGDVGAQAEATTIALPICPGTHLEDLDIPKINELLEFLLERLTTDVYGNFHLKGQRLAKDGRLMQLQEVVALKDELEKLRTIVERKIEATNMESAKEAKRNGKLSTSMA